VAWSAAGIMAHFRSRRPIKGFAIAGFSFIA
jgi:hypothetical protein